MIFSRSRKRTEKDKRTTILPWDTCGLVGNMPTMLSCSSTASTILAITNSNFLEIPCGYIQMKL